jgi:hypothetical protein
VNVPTVSQQPDFDERRALMMALQALVNVEMLTVIARLLDGERSLLDLANALNVQPSLTRGPIGRLIFLEIVQVREEAGRIICTLNRARFYALNGAVQRLSRELFAAAPAPLPADPAARRAEEDRRILLSCLRGEELRELPPLRNARRLHVVLRWLAGQFDYGRTYAESEVNAILQRRHPDFASLRRYLVDFGYMARYYEVYRLLPASEWPEHERSVQ